MSRRKKLFPCGHRGYGQVCHRCAQKEADKQEKRQLKHQWEATFTEDTINLRELPKNVVLKARTIIRSLERRTNYREFHGKRLRHNRFVISIPVTRNYRLLCRDYGSWIIPEEVVSHEEYNVCKPGGS